VPTQISLGLDICDGGIHADGPALGKDPFDPMSEHLSLWVEPDVNFAKDCPDTLKPVKIKISAIPKKMGVVIKKRPCTMLSHSPQPRSQGI
jgi:hypothetical protein